MSFLDQILGGGAGAGTGKPGLGSTVAAGVVLALLVKAVHASQARQQAPEPRSFDPTQLEAPATTGGNGLLGRLGGIGGLIAGGQVSQVLSGLGGAGALGALVDRFRQAGFDQQAKSWVSTGPNQPVAPNDVEHALGGDVINELQQKVGMPRSELLQELARLLPQAISEATPQGRVPTDQELHEISRPQS